MDLKELLGEELYKQVQEKLGDKKLIINDGSYLPKNKFDEKNEEVKLLKEKVTSLEKTTKDTETMLKDNEELKKKFEALQTESKTQLEAKDKQISHITKKTALSKALQDKGARYPDLLIKELDLDTVELDGESIKNFDNLYTPLADKYKDMFTVTEVKGNDPQKGQQSNYDISNMDLSFMDNIK
jgi:protein subunit release factor A